MGKRGSERSGCQSGTLAPWTQKEERGRKGELREGKQCVGGPESHVHRPLGEARVLDSNFQGESIFRREDSHKVQEKREPQGFPPGRSVAWKLDHELWACSTLNQKHASPHFPSGSWKTWVSTGNRTAVLGLQQSSCVGKTLLLPRVLQSTSEC